jgi:hypothetical protein
MSSFEDAQEKNRERQKRYRERHPRNVTGDTNNVTVTRRDANNDIAEASPEAGNKTQGRDSAPSKFDPQTGFSPETERKLLALVNAHPKGKHFTDLHDVPVFVIDAMVQAIVRERGNHPSEDDAYMFILRRTLQYTQQVAIWPRGEAQYAASIDEWFTPSKPGVNAAMNSCFRNYGIT